MVKIFWFVQRACLPRCLAAGCQANILATISFELSQLGMEPLVLPSFCFMSYVLCLMSLGWISCWDLPAVLLLAGHPDAPGGPHAGPVQAEPGNLEDAGGGEEEGKTRQHL